MMIKHLDKENGTQPFNPMKSLQELALIYIVQFLSITKSLFNIVLKKYIYIWSSNNTSSITVVLLQI